MPSDRDTLADLIDFVLGEFTHPIDIAEHLIAAGVRPPARVITDPAELDALPGRSIVIDRNVPCPEVWQLTSHDVYPRPGANWGSPFFLDDRLTSQQLLARVGSVTVLHIPQNGDTDG